MFSENQDGSEMISSVENKSLLFFFLRLSMLYEIFKEEFLKIMCSLVYIFIDAVILALLIAL